MYDAAHTFGVNYKGQSLLNYGNITAISFQAYKPFHMVEGGAVITNSDELAASLHRLRYFGIGEDEKIYEPGINGKSSELHAAVGLCSLRVQEDALHYRKRLWKIYQEELSGLPLQWVKTESGVESNYSYLPLVFPSEQLALRTKNVLKEHDIISKRHFYPSLNTISSLYTSGPVPIAELVANRILFIPLYFTLPETDVLHICSIIKEIFN